MNRKKLAKYKVVSIIMSMAMMASLLPMSVEAEVGKMHQPDYQSNSVNAEENLCNYMNTGGSNNVANDGEVERLTGVDREPVKDRRLFAPAATLSSIAATPKDLGLELVNPEGVYNADVESGEELYALLETIGNGGDLFAGYPDVTRVNVDYLGTEPLVFDDDVTISEVFAIYGGVPSTIGNVVIDEDVTVTCDGFISISNLTVNGDLCIGEYGSVNVEESLTINGSISCGGVLDYSDAVTVTGKDNITYVGDGKSELWLTCSTQAELLAAVERVNAAEPYETFFISLQRTDGQPMDFMLTQNLTIPESVCELMIRSIQSWQTEDNEGLDFFGCDFTIDEGVTLITKCPVACFSGVTINGTWKVENVTNILNLSEYEPGLRSLLTIGENGVLDCRYEGAYCDICCDIVNNGTIYVDNNMTVQGTISGSGSIEGGYSVYRVAYATDMDEVEEKIEEIGDVFGEIRLTGGGDFVFNRNIVIPENIKIYADSENVTAVTIQSGVYVVFGGDTEVHVPMTVNGECQLNGAAVQLDDLTVNGTCNYRGAFGFIEELTVNGEFINNGYFRCPWGLTVNEGGKITNNSDFEADIYQFSNNGDWEGLWPVFTASAENETELKAAVTALGEYNGSISLYSEEPFVISSTVIMPENITLFIGGKMGSGVPELRITDGGLLNTKGMLYVYSDVTVDGGRWSVKGDADISPEAVITVSNTDGTLTDWTDAVQGLGDRCEATYEDGVWTLHKISLLPAPPVDLQWGVKYKKLYNEETESFQQIPVEVPGMISWQWSESGKSNDPVFADVYVYDADTDESIAHYTYGWRGLFIEGGTYEYVSDFTEQELSGGTYYFTIQLSCGGEYGEIVRSADWTYVAPEEQLPACTDVTIDDHALIQFTGAESEYISEYRVEISFSETAEGSREWVKTYFIPGDAANLFLNFEDISRYGNGYYYARVRAVSSDISLVRSGDWSEISDPYVVEDDIFVRGSCGANLTWKLDTDGVLTISGTGDMTDYCTESQDTYEEEPWVPYGGDITAVILEDGVTSIGNYAFECCWNLESVTIPASVTKIGDNAFESCWNLANVYYSGSREQWEAVTIGEDNDALGEAAIDFDGVEGTDYTIDDGVWYVKTETGLRYAVKTLDETGGQIMIVGQEGQPFELTKSLKVRFDFYAPINIHVSGTAASFVVSDGVTLEMSPDDFTGDVPVVVNGVWVSTVAAFKARTDGYRLAPWDWEEFLDGMFAPELTVNGIFQNSSVIYVGGDINLGEDAVFSGYRIALAGAINDNFGHTMPEIIPICHVTTESELRQAVEEIGDGEGYIIIEGSGDFHLTEDLSIGQNTHVFIYDVDSFVVNEGCTLTTECRFDFECNADMIVHGTWHIGESSSANVLGTLSIDGTVNNEGFFGVVGDIAIDAVNGGSLNNDGTYSEVYFTGSVTGTISNSAYLTLVSRQITSEAELRAVAETAKACPEAECVFVGDGEEVESIHITADLEIPENMSLEPYYCNELIVDSGVCLTIGGGTYFNVNKLTVNGECICEGDGSYINSLEVNGRFVNRDDLDIAGLVVTETGTFVNNGTAKLHMGQFDIKGDWQGAAPVYAGYAGTAEELRQMIETIGSSQGEIVIGAKWITAFEAEPTEIDTDVTVPANITLVLGDKMMNIGDKVILCNGAKLTTLGPVKLYAAMVLDGGFWDCQGGVFVEPYRGHITVNNEDHALTDWTDAITGLEEQYGANYFGSGWALEECPWSGYCGDDGYEGIGTNLTWALDDEGTLTISGEGATGNYAGPCSPWWRRQSRIKKIVLERGVTVINNNAFDGLANLTSVTIPDSVTAIRDCAFAWCESLTDIYYDGTEAQWQQITVGESNENLLNAEIHFAGEEILIGDVNLDGIVDENDLTMLTRHIAKIELLTSNGSLVAADVNEDGKIDAADLTELLKRVKAQDESVMLGNTLLQNSLTQEETLEGASEEVIEENTEELAENLEVEILPEEEEILFEAEIV